MRWKKPLICVALAVAATLHLAGGDAPGPGAALLRPAVRGGGRPGGVGPEPGTGTRRGSLRFRRDEHGAPTPSRVLNAKLKLMDPSVQCSDTAMTLKVKGVRKPHFLVDSDNGPLIPFSRMPSDCGFSVKRSRRDVTFTAPYRGCHVTQQAGSYVLPLHLSGTPMVMSCPSATPLPSVTCFRNGMVLKIGGTTAGEVQVKVSGTWTPLLSICGSCGITTESGSGGMTLIAPYHRGQCVSTEDEKYLLHLLMGDVELLVTCPSTTTSAPPTDGGQVVQYPQSPVLPQSPAMPGAPAQPPVPMTAAPPPQLPHRPPYPGQYSADDTSALMAQFYSMQQYPQYSYQLPVFPQFPMLPGLQPTPPPPPPPATTTTPHAPTVKHDGMPQLPHQFPAFPPQFPFLPFRGPLPPGGQAQSPQMLIPHHPQMFQVPMLPNPNYLPWQNAQTAAPTAAAPPTRPPAITTHAPQRPLFNPYHYIPYYVPQQAFLPQLPARPALPEQQPRSVYHVPPQVDPFGYHQSPKLTAGGG